MPNKNGAAIFITYCIALIISWVIWGHTTDHLWSAWVFVLTSLIALLIIELIMFSQINSNTFGGTYLICLIGIIVYGVFLLDGVNNIGIQSLRTIDYIISGILALTLIFSVVRYFQYQQANA